MSDQEKKDLSMERLAETIRKVPEEKRPVVEAYMAGYLAGMETMAEKRAV